MERANSLPSSRLSRNTVPVSATRTVCAGRMVIADVSSQPVPVVPSWKIAARPR